MKTSTLVSGWKPGLDVIRKSSNAINKSSNKNFLKTFSTPIVEKIERSIVYVDNALGVSEVSKAQEEVCVKENSFLSARTDVQNLNFKLKEAQGHLNDIRKKLDRTDRTNENYLALVSEEHKLLLEVSKIKKSHELAEETERINFMEYSSAVRLSHEKERSRVERTKYWSIIGSVSGTVLGFFLSSIVTHYRVKNIKDLTQASLQDAVDKINISVNENVSKRLEEILSTAVSSSLSRFEEEEEEEKQTATSEHSSTSKLILENYTDLKREISSINSKSNEILEHNKAILSLSKDLMSQNSRLEVLSNNKDVLETPICTDSLSKDVSITSDDESYIDLPHTSILILATIAICVYGFMGTS